eukprot:9167705-Lingulodinium_polyedra.AAC.1
MGGRQTTEQFDRAITIRQCLSVSRGMVRLVRHVGPRKKAAGGLGVGAGLDGFMMAAVFIGRAMDVGQMHIPG